MNTVLKSYKKVEVTKDLQGGNLPAGEYVVRHQDKHHTILWEGADGQAGNGIIVDTVPFLTAKASGLIRNK
jgi:hypothetical protein